MDVIQLLPLIFLLLSILVFAFPDVLLGTPFVGIVLLFLSIITSISNYYVTKEKGLKNYFSVISIVLALLTIVGGAILFWALVQSGV